ncbi:NYN domain-containing protein [Roseofilum casamattae]|uniref:NYN domain-containing protein n=1 Tax=Roseofilum casamattae BLCC-M143 TaxID=3022442 RepID=A0ABT7BZ68_9CYAN|nr:NYN domain-containing protein [Roseofilum casamattae]MDJ1183741.1 NYN domain-containing protein [Roseofilum casamattae BLCC-M143]
MSRPSHIAILFVDGYNIIGAWSDLQDLRDRHGLEVARQHLIEVMTSYSAFRGYDTRIVFDAYQKATRDRHETITANLSVCYTNFGQTADSYIEVACAKFRNSIEKYEKRLIVATSDRAQQITVIGYGAEWMSASKLAQDVSAADRQVRRPQSSQTKHRRPSLENSLDPALRQRLEALRFG